SSRRRHTRFSRDWSSDVCSSDLSVSTYEQFLLHYQYLQRSVREQVLDLSQEQALKVVQFLNTNYEPENRFYRYDFFFDNCATRKIGRASCRKESRYECTA